MSEPTGGGPETPAGRSYDLVHRTEYTYAADVTRSYGRATLTPRTVPGQVCHRSAVTVSPEPDELQSHVDYFGNSSTSFMVAARHRHLVVTARSRITVTRRAPRLEDLPAVPWEEVAGRLRGPVAALAASPEVTDAVALRESVLPSRHVRPGPAVRAYAEPTFAPGRPLAEVVAELAHRIRAEFAFRSGSTTIRTTQEELLAAREGVCQDFTHLMLACLRSHGLAARYASGYIETLPAPGRPKLRGADASHAWVSVWIPGAGWVDVDPTNDRFVGDQHVVLGWGRDYADVKPLHGVVFTEGRGSTLTVKVDLAPAGSEPVL